MTSFCFRYKKAVLAVGKTSCWSSGMLNITLVCDSTLNIPPQTRGCVSQEFTMKKQKVRTKQRLSENISEIVTTRDEFDPQSTMKNTAPHKMIIHFNVLGFGMKDRIGGQSNCRFVVTLKNWNVRKKQFKFLKESTKPSQLYRCGSQDTILCLGGRMWDSRLLLGRPWDWAWTKKN